MSLENSQIANFFTNQTIFLTGGTGLLGQLLIEKLLRTCWNLKKIYVLMRPKRGKTAQNRFEELFDDPCFDLIKDKNLRAKVGLISGDCGQASMGIGPEDLEILKNETTCIFHVAANVKFDQSLREASCSIAAIKDILELAKDIRNLKVFVYVSTAYSNCIYSHIKEDFYEPPLTPEVFLGLVHQVDDDVLTKMTPLLLGEWPNSYVYMKSISENLIKKSTVNVPLAIIRPSIIMNTFDEPKKGWINKANGLIGVVVAVYFGLVRSCNGTKKNKLYLIPADHVCNCILAATWRTVQDKWDKPIIYNCVGTAAPLENAINIFLGLYWDFPSDKYLWFPSFKVRDNKFWHYFIVFCHLILINMIDLIFFFLGKPTNVAKKYKYINNMMYLTSHFTTLEWSFDQNNVTSLWKEMSDVDRRIFKFNQQISDWYEYYRNCALGIRLYLLKDPIETLPKRKRKLKILFVAHYVTIGLLFCLLFYCLFNLFL